MCCVLCSDDGAGEADHRERVPHSVQGGDEGQCRQTHSESSLHGQLKYTHEHTYTCTYMYIYAGFLSGGRGGGAFGGHSSP